MRSQLRIFARLLPFAAIVGCQSGTGPGPTTPPPPIQAGRAGEFPSLTVTANNLRRAYRLVVPTSVDLTQPAPLVVAFHGMLIDSKDVMPVYTKLNDLAASQRFILVYPQAIGGSWGLAVDKIANDLLFFDALVSQIATAYRVDPNRIYVVGMSNGGYFAHLVGRERSTMIAAVVSHSGPLGLQTLLGIRADRKFPVLIIHGDQDPIFPVAFARENRDKYAREGHPVEYLEVPGLGHEWATRVSVNDTIGRFFAAHRR